MYPQVGQPLKTHWKIIEFHYNPQVNIIQSLENPIKIPVNHYKIQTFGGHHHGSTPQVFCVLAGAMKRLTLVLCLHDSHWA